MLVQYPYSVLGTTANADKVHGGLCGSILNGPEYCSTVKKDVFSPPVKIILVYAYTWSIRKEFPPFVLIHLLLVPHSFVVTMPQILVVVVMVVIVVTVMVMVVMPMLVTFLFVHYLHPFLPSLNDHGIKRMKNPSQHKHGHIQDPSPGTSGDPTTPCLRPRWQSMGQMGVGKRSWHRIPIARPLAAADPEFISPPTAATRCPAAHFPSSGTG